MKKLIYGAIFFSLLLITVGCKEKDIPQKSITDDKSEPCDDDTKEFKADKPFKLQGANTGCKVDELKDNPPL